MPEKNNLVVKFFFGVVLVFCLSLFWGASARAALYATYADVSNTSTFGAMPTWEISQIYKMPIRGRINSIQIKANGVDGAGTSMLRPSVCRVAGNAVGSACVGSYVWANENPYISRGLKWYSYTFPDTLFDKNAYVKFYFDKNGSRLFWQEYAVKAPSSTYADGSTWITGSSYAPEQNFDMQVLLDITPCNDAFSGHVFSTSTGEAAGGAKVRMILNDFIATDESCDSFLATYASRGDAYCYSGEGAGLVAETDGAGYYNFLAPEEVGGNFIVQTTADDFTTTTVPYGEIYTNNGACYNPIFHDFFLEPVFERTPIVIVPGILGSYLYNLAGEEVWPNIPLILVDPWDLHLNQLALSFTGVPQGNEVMAPNDIFRKVSSGSDFFQGLIDELANAGYVEGKDLFVFPYDWRLENAVNSDLLKTKIDDIKNYTSIEKVNIIAHSMGGLVVKKYINDYGQNSVDKFIDIATPHLGSPKAFKILTYGDDLGIGFYIFGLNIGTIKNISQNIPSIYQLLPSRKYFYSADADYNSYISDVYDIDRNGVQGNLNFDQSIVLMKNTGRNEYLLSKNDELHSDIDSFDPSAYGIKAYNIVGCGMPTIGKTYILNKEANGYEYGLKYISGDGTVPLRSAEGLINAVKTYYTTGAEHSLMPSFSGVKELVAAIVDGKANGFEYLQYPNIKQNSAACALNGWQVSFHSPIELHIYDENNNHLGPGENGAIEMGIQGASYDIIDGNKFAFLPKGHAYRIIGQATDGGTFNARIQDIQNSEIATTQYFNRIPLDSTSTNVAYVLNDQTEKVEIMVDEDGDNEFENTVESSAVLNQTESQDAVKPQTAASLTGLLGQNGWYTSDVQVALNSQDSEKGSGILKTEYSFDGGATWQEYSSPIILSEDGRHAVQYRALDKAGNIENTNEALINIDKTVSAIDLFFPINNVEYSRADSITPVFDIIDVMSGVATDTIKISVDGAVLNTGTANLFDFSLGPHVLAIFASDLAGNNVSTTINFSITTSIDGVISDVDVFYNGGGLNEKAHEQSNDRLNLIKKQIEKFGQRKIVIDEKFAGAMKKCIAKKGSGWCEKQLKPRMGKIAYTVNKIYKTVVSLQYRLILFELNQYQNKSWINLQAYNTLKEDINFLINELK